MDFPLVILVLCVGLRAPNSDASQVTATSVGKNVTLLCQIPHMDSDLHLLYWRKDGKTVYSLTNNGENANGKYSVIDTTSLLIPDVDDNDAGNFSCKVVDQSLSTEESDVIQLLVLDLSVSNCKDTRQDVDGCSCYINGADIPSLNCSASGFPNSPVITWSEREITYGSPSVDLTRYNKNLTLMCKAQDRNLQSVVANKTVCVHYSGVKPHGPTRETTIAPVKDETPVAAIILGTLLAFVCLTLFILWLIYRRKMGKDLCLRPVFTNRFFRTSTPKTSREPPKPKLRAINSSGYGGEIADVFKDSFKNSEASGTAPVFSKLDGIEAVDMGLVDYLKKDWNEDVDVDDENPLPLVGQVLLDDLKSSTEEDKESMKAVILALLEKRIEPYKMHQSHVDPCVTVKASSADLDETLQRSMMIDKFNDPDASFVDMVLQDLGQILDERDRDECEILITKPGFQEVKDESEIPACQGDRVQVIHQSLQMDQQDQAKTPHMTGSMVARIPLSSVLREELMKRPSERRTIRDDISQIILDFMKKGHSGLRTNDHLKNSTAIPNDTNVEDDVSRLVAFWTSKMANLDNDVNIHIRKYLFHLKPRITKPVLNDEKPLPLVGQVLLDDLKSSTEEDKESMKAVILALLEKRIEPYKMHQSHVEPYVTVKASSSDLNETMQRSMMIDKCNDPDASFVDMVLQDLDRILDERDRDECEILITKPCFQEVKDESEIPAYQGDRVLIHQSLRMHQVKSSHMNDSMVTRIPLSSILRKELLKKPSERSTIRNAISQIILDFMKKGHSGLRTSNNLKYSTSTPIDTNVDGEVFRLVAFWTSKTAKLDNDVNNHIRKYLFPLKPRITNKCPDADPLIARRQEEEEQEEIPETPSSAKLLEESIQR